MWFYFYFYVFLNFSWIIPTNGWKFWSVSHWTDPCSSSLHPCSSTPLLWSRLPLQRSRLLFLLLVGQEGKKTIGIMCTPRITHMKCKFFYVQYVQVSCFNLYLFSEAQSDPERGWCNRCSLCGHTQRKWQFHKVSYIWVWLWSVYWNCIVMVIGKP